MIECRDAVFPCITARPADQEKEILCLQIGALPQAEQRVTAEACETTCKALRKTLEGLYNQECVDATDVANG